MSQVGTTTRGEYLDDLRENVPLCVIVTHFLEMRTTCRGRELVGLSPFAKEKTPSFFVIMKHPTMSDQYKDFSSGKGGNVLSFLLEARGIRMDPKDAVQFICELTGYHFIPRKFQRVRSKRRRSRVRGI